MTNVFSDPIDISREWELFFTNKRIIAAFICLGYFEPGSTYPLFGEDNPLNFLLYSSREARNEEIIMG